MLISDELKSKGFLQCHNLVVTYSAETDSAILSEIYCNNIYGIGEEQAAWIWRTFRLEYVSLSERGTIIQLEDAVGTRVPRATVDRYYGYVRDENKLYQLTAYASDAARAEIKLPKLDEEYRERRILLFIKHGKIHNYHTNVRIMDTPRVRVVNDYCKQVNKYLRVAAAMAHLECKLGNNFSTDTYRIVARSLQERASPQEAAFRVIEALDSEPDRMPLARTHEVYLFTFCSPSIQMEYLYVRK